VKNDKAVIDWLLEPSDPSVRYYTLTDLLGRRRDDAEVIEAKRAIMGSDPVAKILSKQEPGGYWGRPEDFYMRSKYKGTVWNLILLAELGAAGQDERVGRACEFVLEHAQNHCTGGFSVRMDEIITEGNYMVIPCLTGNMVFSLVRFGLLDDMRVRKGIEFLTRYQRFDDGKGRPRGYPYDREPDCYGAHTCTYGIAKTLKAMAEIPPRRRGAAVRRTIDAGAEFLLMHRLYRRSHDPSRTAKPIWTKLGYPLFWGTDALDMLLLLAQLGYRDERMSDAVKLVEKKRGADGRWRLEHSFNGRMLVRIGRDGEPSKWVTLRALTALRLLDR
jgi:hypothetical protein